MAPRFHIPSTFFSIVSLLGLATCSELSAADVPQLVLEGPANQVVIAVVRYYDQSQPSKTVTNRVDLAGDSRRVLVPLEVGHEGARVYLIVPTSREVNVQIIEGGRRLAEESSQERHVIALPIGRVPPDDYHPPDPFLTEAQQRFVQNFVRVLADPQLSSRGLVSTLPIANVEWQVVDAYCNATVNFLGLPLERQLASTGEVLDGWLSWPGSLGSRVLAGPIGFEEGACFFRLMLIDEEIVDIEVAAPDMPEHWFGGPVSHEQYAEEAEHLTRDLLSGDVATAFARFSARYHDRIKIEDIAELSRTLQGRFLSRLLSVDLLHTQLTEYEAESRTRNFDVLLTLGFEDETQAISQVRFVFPCGADVISKGHLAAVTVRQSWPSAAPQLIEHAQRALHTLLASDTSFSADEFLQQLHPTAAHAMDANRLAARQAEMHIRWGALASEPNWLLWKTESVADRLRAVGPIDTGRGQVEAELIFAEGRMVGLTLADNGFAISTLDLSRHEEMLSRQSEMFWEQIYAGRLEEAYQLLVAEFREQLTLAAFREMIAASHVGEKRPQIAEIVTDSVRLSARVDRPLPVLWEYYGQVIFQDGTTNPVRCELRISSAESEVTADLLGFTDDFTASLAAPADAHVETILRPFFEGDVEAVLQLFRPEDRERIDRQVLAGFLQALAGELEDAEVPEQARRFIHYAPGGGFESLQAQIGDAKASFKFEAELQQGALRSFYFHIPGGFQYAEEIADVDGLESLGQNFLRQWLQQRESAEAASAMVDELQDEGMVRVLTDMRQKLEDVYGPYLVSEMTEWKADAATNRIVTTFEVDFARQTVPFQVSFALNAISGRIVELHQLPAVEPGD